METKIVNFKETETKLDYVRTMTKEEFIENYGSGTLRKNARIGLKHNSQYWDERIAYEFGWEFQMLPASRVTVGVAQTEGDVKGLTEYGWFVERYITTRVFEEDIVKPCFIQVEDSEGNKTEGNGIVIEQTSFNIPTGKVIFAFVTVFNTENNEWEEALNPF